MRAANAIPAGGARAWGALAVGFFVAHAVWHARLGDTGNVLWACHVASLLIGIGGLVRNPTLVAIGLLWLVVGIPLWFYHLAVGGPLLPTSLLTHFGGAAVGCILLYRSRLPSRKPTIWWRASVGFVVLVLISRLVTVRSQNVNLAFDIHGRSDTSTGEHLQYLMILGAVVSVVFYLSEIIFRRVLFKPCDTS